MKYVVAFLRSWWDFVVGDDWRVAVGVVAALGADRGARGQRRERVVADAAAVVLILFASLRHATRVGTAR